MSVLEQYNGARLTSRTYLECEKAVADLYVMLDITMIPINPFAIMKRKGYDIMEFSECSLPKDVKQADAFSFIHPHTNAKTIVINPNRSEQRKRFSLMHEIGHIILKHQGSSDYAELMADYFAGYALAPPPVVDLYRIKNYQELAEVFNVSDACAEVCFNRYKKWKENVKYLRTHEKQLIGLFKYNVK